MSGAEVATGLSEADDREQADHIGLKVLDYSYLHTDDSLVDLPPGKPMRSF